MTLADLSVQLEARIDSRARRAVGIDHPVDLFSHVIARHMKPGNSGSNTANQIYHGTRTLGSSASEVLSLDGNAFASQQLRNALGEVVSFTSVSLIAIKSSDAELFVGNAPSEPWAPMFPVSTTDRVRIPVGSTMVRYNPGTTWPVSPQSSRLMIANQAAAPTTYEIVLAGRGVDLGEPEMWIASALSTSSGVTGTTPTIMASVVIPANTFFTGAALRAFGEGFSSGNGTPAALIEVRMGGTIGSATDGTVMATIVIAGAQTNPDGIYGFDVRAVQRVGGSGTLFGWLSGLAGPGAGTKVPIYQTFQGTINTAVDLPFKVVGYWTGAGGSPGLTVDVADLWIARADAEIATP